MTSTFNCIKQTTDFFLCNCDNYCAGKQPKNIQLALYKDFSCQMITIEENQSTQSRVKTFNQPIFWLPSDIKDEAVPVQAIKLYGEVEVQLQSF